MSVTLSSTGVGQTIVNTSIGPNLAVKGLNAGTGITLSPSANDITINNTCPTRYVTLSNAGQTSIINTGVGPALAMKGLSAGNGVAFGVSATDVTVTATNYLVTLTSVGTGDSLVNSGGPSTLLLNGLLGSNGIGVIESETDLTLSDDGSIVTLANAGSMSLVSSRMTLNGLAAGSNIELTVDDNNITIVNSCPTASISNGGSGVSLVAGGMAMAGLVAGNGITFPTISNVNVTIASPIVQSPTVYFCGKAGPNQSFCPFGFYNPSIGTTIVQTTVTNGQTLPQTTITVANTAGFANSGSIQVGTDSGVCTVTYTGLTGTSFVGCTGGNGMMASGAVITQIVIGPSGVAPGGCSGLNIYGTWYDPMSAWNTSTCTLSISPTGKYLTSWTVPIGGYVNDVNDINTGSFTAWANCGDGFNAPSLKISGSTASFGGGGNGVCGTVIASSGTAAINVPTNGDETISTTWTQLGVFISNDISSTTSVDVGPHVLPDDSFEILGASWIVYQI